MLKKLWIFCSLNRKYFLSIPHSLYYNYRLLPFYHANKVTILFSKFEFSYILFSFCKDFLLSISTPIYVFDFIHL